MISTSSFEEPLVSAFERALASIPMIEVANSQQPSKPLKMPIEVRRDSVPLCNATGAAEPHGCEMGPDWPDTSRQSSRL
jgi:hypothetical protein